MQVLLIIIRSDDILRSFRIKVIEKSCFFAKVTLTKQQKKAPGRDAGHRSPEWGCISDPQILKFKGGKPSGGRRTPKILTVRIYR